MDWRELIHGYLTACNADHEKGLSGWKEREEILFLERFGTDALKKRREQSHSAVLQERKGTAPPDTYTLVEESADRLVADVKGVEDAGGEPRWDTRFVLKRDGDGWLIHDMYWRCFACQMETEPAGPGKCLICKGTGKCSTCLEIRKVRNWLWHIIFFLYGRPECGSCHGTGQCCHCGGTGRCDYCAGSDMPGWNSLSEKRKPKAQQPTSCLPLARH